MKTSKFPNGYYSIAAMTGNISCLVGIGLVMFFIVVQFVPGLYSANAAEVKTMTYDDLRAGRAEDT